MLTLPLAKVTQSVDGIVLLAVAVMFIPLGAHDSVPYPLH